MCAMSTSTSQIRSGRSNSDATIDLSLEGAKSLVLWCPEDFLPHVTRYNALVGDNECRRRYEANDRLKFVF